METMPEKEQAVTMSPADLQQLIAAAVGAAVAEAKKPVITEKDKRDLEMAQQSRQEQSELVKKIAADKMRRQKICSHMRRDGSTRGVYVENGNFIVCLGCQGIIRPGTAPENYKGSDIHDTDLFNRLFQLTSDSGLFA